MRKHPFSSQKRKPLLLASLVASLVLHMGGLYFIVNSPFPFFNLSLFEKKNPILGQTLTTDLEIEFALTKTLNRLILKEETPAALPLDRPQLEITEQKLNIISNFTYIPDISSSPIPPPFHIDNPLYSISKGTEPIRLKLMTPKSKKWTYFSQSLEIEPLITAQKSNEEQTSLYVQSLQEDYYSIAHTQQTDKIPLIDPKTVTETPFAAHNFESSVASEMITPEVKPKKVNIDKQKQSAEDPPFSSHPIPIFYLEKTPPSSLVPTIEKNAKEKFDRETLYFFYDEKFKSSPLPTLEMNSTVASTLFTKPFAPSKKTLLTFTPSNTHFFTAIAPLNLTPLSEAQETFQSKPYIEKVAYLNLLANTKPSKVDRLKPSLSRFIFKLSEPISPFNLIQNNVKTKKLHIAYTSALTFPKPPPNNSKETVSSCVRKPISQPKKENMQFLTIPEDGKWRHQNQIISFHGPISFGLSNDSLSLFTSRWIPPKQELRIHPSLEVLPKPSHMSQTSPRSTSAKQQTLVPKHETVHSLIIPSANNVLAYQMYLPSCETKVVSFVSPQTSFSVPLVLAEPNFLRRPLFSMQQSNWKHIATPESTCFIEPQAATKSLQPRQEEIKPLKYEPSFALNLNEIELNTTELDAPENLKTVPLAPAYLVVPKQRFSKLPATFSIKPSVSTLKEVHYDHSSSCANIFQPKEEELPLSLTIHPAKELIYPALPSYLMKSYPKHIAFDLNKVTTLSVTPYISRIPVLATLPTEKQSLTLTFIQKQIPLDTSQLAQTMTKKSKIKPEQEIAISSSPKHEPAQPHIPQFSDPTPPYLDLKGGNLAIKGDTLSLSKKEVDIQDLLAMPALPYLKEKRIVPGKLSFKPTKALTELQKADIFYALIPRQEAYSNTKRLLSTGIAPNQEPQIEIDTEYTLAKKVKEPETANIQSQAKELLENYQVDILTQNAFVKLSTPKPTSMPSERDFHTLNETHRMMQGCLAEIPAATTLDTISYNNDFETTVTYVKKPEGQGYHFALKIKPNEKLYFGSPEQNFIFIIDGSGTIKKHRYNIFKDAVVKSLSYMRDGDSFNILVADSQIAAMSPKPMAWSKNVIGKVHTYLQTRAYRGYFSNYDAFHLLSKASDYFDPNKENIVIFITDGHSLESITKHKEPLKALAQGNKGRFSLFTASASQGNNITMLDLISTFNNGEFIYSPTNAAFPRKLSILVKHIESFIAKDIRIHVTSANKALDVQFYPNQESYPFLYADHAYTLYGSIDKLEDFDLLLQGRSGDHWIHIKQHISFKNAEVAGYKLKRNFALQQAYACYDYYLKKNDPFFLAEAERVLTPYVLTPATQ